MDKMAALACAVAVFAAAAQLADGMAGGASMAVWPTAAPAIAEGTEEANSTTAETSSILDLNHQPSQIHIALAGQNEQGDATSMAVSWFTRAATESVVRFGTMWLTKEAVGSSTSYLEGHGFHHTVVLPPLDPDTRYSYQVGDNTKGFSSVRTFRTAPSSAETTETKFAFWADLGHRNGESTFRFMAEQLEEVSVMLHGGDIAYADNSFLYGLCSVSFCYEETWNAFMEDMEPLAASVPYMVAPGNHEIECHSPSCMVQSKYRDSLANFTAYDHRFHMPSTEAESNGVGNMWYSFNHGLVHFVAIDTETAFAGAPQEDSYILPCGGFGDMLTWLEADLKQAQAQRELRPWIVVYGHHPMYWGANVNVGFRDAIEALFNKYQVNAYFCGHKHEYMRSYPIVAGESERSYELTAGYTQFLVGGSGCDEMAWDWFMQLIVATVEDDHIFAEHEDFTAYHDEGHLGVTIITASRTHFVVDYFHSEDGTLRDSVTITQPDPTLAATAEPATTSAGAHPDRQAASLWAWLQHGSSVVLGQLMWS